MKLPAKKYATMLVYLLLSFYIKLILQQFRHYKDNFLLDQQPQSGYTLRIYFYSTSPPL